MDDYVRGCRDLNFRRVTKKGNGPMLVHTKFARLWAPLPSNFGPWPIAARQPDVPEHMPSTGQLPMTHVPCPCASRHAVSPGRA